VGSQRDLGYSSAEEPIVIQTDLERPPHRTQLLSPAASPLQQRRNLDTQYDASYLNRDRQHASDEKSGARDGPIGDGPYRNAGYGPPHVRRQFDISPRSTGSSGGRSSAQISPDKTKGRGRNADDILVSSYHQSKTTVEYPPRRRELSSWIRDD